DQVAVGNDHACVRVAGGAVECWGAGAVAAFEPGNPPRAAPVGAHVDARRVVGLRGAVEIAVGAAHGCARLGDGSVVCGGAGESGQLGDGGSADRRVPVRVRGLDPATALALGRAHSCALLRSGHVACWGDNTLAQLGDSTTTARPHPTLVAGLTNVVGIG